MSQSINLYLVRKDNATPIHFYSVSRNNEMYNYLYDNMYIPYCGLSGEPNYEELTPDKIKTAINNVVEDIERSKRRIDTAVDAVNKLKNIPQDYIETYVSEYCSDQSYLQDLFNIKNDLEGILFWVTKVYRDYGSDFNKVLINIS